MTPASDETVRAFCYVEGFLNGIMKAHGNDPMAIQSLDIIWKFIDKSVHPKKEESAGGSEIT